MLNFPIKTLAPYLPFNHEVSIHLEENCYHLRLTRRDLPVFIYNMQCQYFLVSEGEDLTNDNFRENANFHRLNTLWWFEWWLEQLAQQLGVTPLTEFITFSRRELIWMAGQAEVERVEREGWAGEGGQSLETEWFLAAAGLRTVGTLLKHIQAHPESLAEAQPGENHNRLVGELISALQGLQTDLEHLKQQRKQFRLYKE